MQQSKVVETWVGLFVALGLAGLFFLAMKVSNLGDLQSKDHSFKVFARFQNAGSLRERSPVSMAGVRIGRVSSIRFDKETYEAVVEMRIDPEYDTIPTDTTANVLTAGLLGEQYIGLSAGGADEYLKNGDEIELTQSAMVLEEVISRFLFNKAEGAAENKGAAAAGGSDEDVAADGSIGAGKAATAAPAKSLEQAPVHAPKPKPEEEGAEEPPVAAARPPKAGHGKPAEDARAEHPPKAAAHGKPAEASHGGHAPQAAHGKPAEEAEPAAHKTAKPAAKAKD